MFHKFYQIYESFKIENFIMHPFVVCIQQNYAPKGKINFWG